jgi:hypothetical protein
MKKQLLSILIIIFLFSNSVLLAQTTSRDLTIPVYAAIQESPAKITLKWTAETNHNGYKIYRKLKDGGSWGTAIGNLAATDSFFIDNNIVIGQVYDYYIYKFIGTKITAIGYLQTGIKIPETDQKGILILLVDKNYIPTLDDEIQQLEEDIIGDGWQIIRHNIDRNSKIPDIKAIIINDYNTNQNVKALFILGRIPVPYSGLFPYVVNVSAPPDGHPDHTGAWPADCYYGDINGSWTDLDSNVAGGREANKNRVGDGKFDQTFLPSNNELQIGRVDLYNMPSFSSNDTLLIKSYLDKDHNFKIGKIASDPRGLIDDNFTGNSLASQAWKGFSAMFGPQNINSTADYFTEMRTNSYLWSCGTGGGSFNSCSGIGTSANFAQDSLNTIFTMLSGSYFGDWDNQDNLLRAPLASRGTTLVDFWGGIPSWFVHFMAMGEDIGYCTNFSQNNENTLFYNFNFNGSSNCVHMALMGDPTLRMHVVKPASALNATPISGNQKYSLNWQGSNDNIIGYNIYRANKKYGKFTKINSTIVTGTSYTDNSPLAGKNAYMVRAVKLETSASGSYYNMSIGALDVNTINSINEPIMAKFDLNLYPNPNHGKFSISIKTLENDDLNCEVVNPLGEVIYNDQYLISTASFIKTIDLGNIEKGIYILRITGKDSFVTKQLIIQ